MSRKNRERRDANRRARRQPMHGPGPSRPEPRPAGESWPSRARDIERDLLDQLDALWRNGWQPAELCRQMHRSAGSDQARLAPWAVAANRARSRALRVDRRWQQQLDDLAPPGSVPASGWLQHWAAAHGRDAESTLRAAVLFTTLVGLLGRIPTLIPPPGTSEANVDEARAARPIDDALLAKVRALLAQAESTNFVEEAETFTAKAQELITRHAIDEALLSGTNGSRNAGTFGHEPTAVRIGIDNPYPEIKSLLAHYVAQHLRCRAVWNRGYATTTIIGMPTDVAAAELLFTSLLVQAQTAMQSTARNAPAGSRPRSRGFRSSFLLAYAQRVSERLAEIDRYTMHRATRSDRERLLPALAARSASVDRKVDDMFGKLASSTVRSPNDLAGWTSGKVAADRARLDGGAVTPRTLTLPSG